MMQIAPRLSTALLRSSPALLLEWTETTGRPMAFGATELATRLQLSPDAATADGRSLDQLLGRDGRDALDAQFATVANAGSSSGVLSGIRIVCNASTAHSDSQDTLVRQVWLDLTIEWQRRGTEPLRCTALAMDVSTEVAAERDAAVQAERYDLAIDGTDLGTWDWDPATDHLTINRYWIEMLGEPFESPHLKTTDWEKRVHPDDIAQAYADITAHMEGETEQYENIHRMRHCDGHWIYVLVRGRVVERNDDGEVRRFSGTHTNITQQAEAALAVRAAAKSKSAFLATMSHEIRTPLHGILGMLQVLEGTELSGEQVEATRLAASSGEHLLVLINDILEISKIEAGEFQLDPQPFNVSSWLVTVASLFRSRAEEKDVALDITSSLTEATWICADDHRLRQVLGNLVSNAIKFTDDGSVTVEAELHSDPVALTVRVRDTGKGIEDTDRIWASFCQEDASVSRKYGGTGLGLSLSRQLVELMGGTIEVQSEVGIGSTFSFTVPVGHAARPAHTASTGFGDPTEQLDHLNVLVAEDNAVNRRVAMAIFLRMGLQVTFAEDGAQAIESCRDKAFDLVLMDLHMPIVNGFDAAEAILDEHGESAPPIVALSADLTEASRQRCAQIGFQDHLGKPFRVVELANILRSAAAGRAA